MSFRPFLPLIFIGDPPASAPLWRGKEKEAYNMPKNLVESA